MFKKIHDRVIQISLYLIYEGEGSHSHPWEGPIKGKDNHVSPTPKVMLYFPHFNGSEDLISWLYRVDQFFKFHSILVVEWVSLESYHLKGDA
jgi:hypothetical protein